MISAPLEEDRGSLEPSSQRAVGLARSALLLFAVLLPALAALGILYEQSLSLPYQDDYPAILGFAAHYNKLQGANEKLLAVATEQYFDYKLAFEHSIIAVELEATHHLNFAFLTGFGDLLLLPIAHLLWRTYIPRDGPLHQRLLEFLPISLVFFALTYWDTLNWAMAELQNLPVILFSFVAIYLITAEHTPLSPSRLGVGCLMAVLAAFASANGFLLIPLGLFILTHRRAYRGALAWCAAFALPLAAYLYHYAPHAHPLSRIFYLTRPLFFLAFFGSVFPSRWIAALAGFGVLLILCLAVRSGFYRDNPVAVYFALWVVGTGGLVAWVRGGGGFSIASRYSMYSSLLLVFCYGFLAHHLRTRSPRVRRRFLNTAILLACAGCLLADGEAYRSLGARRRMVLSGIELYRADPALNSPMIDPQVDKLFPWEKRFEQTALTNAIQSKLLTLPPQQANR